MQAASAHNARLRVVYIRVRVRSLWLYACIHRLRFRAANNCKAIGSLTDVLLSQLSSIIRSCMPRVVWGAPAPSLAVPAPTMLASSSTKVLIRCWRRPRSPDSSNSSEGTRTARKTPPPAVVAKTIAAAAMQHSRLQEPFGIESHVRYGSSMYV